MGPNAPVTGPVARDRGAARVEDVASLSKKRIKFRFWLAVIALGAMIWVALAYSLGLI